MSSVLASIHRHGTRTKRAITAAALALPLVLGAAAVVPAAAQATTTCGQSVRAVATNLDPVRPRLQLIDTQACVDIAGTNVRVQGRVLTFGLPDALCRGCGSLFEQLTLRVWADGAPAPCWSVYLNRTTVIAPNDCAIALGKKPRGTKVTARAQVCFDVRDDHRDVICGPIASFTTTV